jgi:predicted dehydrogenase
LSKRPDSDVVAFADPNMERMREARRLIGRESIGLYADAAEMLRAEAMEVVVVTSPDYLHRDHIITALRAGRHVIADKPLATSAAACKEIGRASRESGKHVFMGFNLRHEIVCRRIKELVDGGVVGRVVIVKNEDFYGGGRTYMARWNRFYAKSGGLFCHKGSHDFDTLNWFNAGGLPVRVSAFAGVEVLQPKGLPFALAPGEKAGPQCDVCQVAYKCKDRYPDIGRWKAMWYGKAREADGYCRDECIYLSEKDTHDSGVAIVEYDNGVRASHWECFFTPVNTRRYTIIGDRGHLDADLALDHITVYPRWTQDRIEYNLRRPEGGHGGADPDMLHSFVEALKTGRRPLTTIRDGTLSVAIADAAERSRREGRIVMIEELITRKEIEELP